MEATQGLQNDHELIEHVASAVERQAESAVATGVVDVEFFRRALDFFRGFTDTCHHGKEESILFPALERAGMPGENGPIGVMLAEHEEGRDHLRHLAQAIDAYAAGDRTAAQTVAREAAAYAALIESHIEKENSVLFPWAEEILAEDDKAKLLDRMDEYEAKVMGPGVHERYHELAHALMTVNAAAGSPADLSHAH